MGTDFGNLLCLGDRARVIVPTEGKEVELFDSPNSGEEGIPRLSHKVAQMWSKRVIGRGDRHLKDVSSQTSTNVFRLFITEFLDMVHLFFLVFEEFSNYFCTILDSHQQYFYLLVLWSFDHRNRDGK